MTAFTLSVFFLSVVAAAQHSTMPAGMTHEQHLEQMKKDAAVKEHGQQAMGFDQDTTTHHFTLEANGGAIAVDVNVPSDATGIEQIRSHLKEIAVAFRQGDFAKPLMTHGEEPPGVLTLQRLKAQLTYTYADTPRGGIVRIATSNAQALEALHAFLRYQIREHKTGDPLTPRSGPAAMGAHTGHQGAATPDHFAHRFDNPEDLAKNFDDPARDAWQMPAHVIDALQLKAGDVVADIGSGTGYFTVRLARSAAAPKVYAVDIEPAMRDYVTRRAAHEGLKNVTAVLAGPDQTNLPEKVDVALLVDTFHHIPNRVAYFTALKARLKPGARLAIIDFRKESPEGPPVEFRFVPDQISAELAQAGFVLQSTHDFLPRQMFLVYRVK
jgi:ubiquinone/menaquinone biosynthesis C-methylase UbiE